MASFSFYTLPTSTSTSTIKNPLFSKSSSHVKHSHRFKFSCKAAADNNENSDTPKLILPKSPSLNNMQNVDRRNLLLGLGGLYSAANLTTIPSAFAIPIQAPDSTSNCVTASGVRSAKEAIRGLSCCPPVPNPPVKPVDYKFPDTKVIRIRPAAQRVSGKYVDDFRKAVEIMKGYDDDNPHSWTQQAKIHCAYCNGGYSQAQSGKEFENYKIQVHNSWLFFPFHRWYLYFLEKIMGEVIGDSSFGLPYWNWDHPMGMTVPDMYEEKLKRPENISGGPEEDIRYNSLFDPLRNASHLPPALIDFQYDSTEEGVKTCAKQIDVNLSVMYSQMIANALDTESFFGTAFVAGNPADQKNKKGGSIENGVHTIAHQWVGNNRFKNGEDMGNFYSAGYDPLFYGHHANVDRMWKIWKGMNKRTHHEPTSPDWLDASYVFYDEKKNLVRVYNRDCVDTRTMGYDYERSDIPWIRNRPNPHPKGRKDGEKPKKTKMTVDDLNFPVKLNQTLEVRVQRPGYRNSVLGIEKLLLEGVTYDCERFVKFDVIMNDPDNGVEVTPSDTEFLGSFSQLPHGMNAENRMKMSSGISFPIKERLNDLGAEDNDFIFVKIVPKAGCHDVTISKIEVVMGPIDVVPIS
ncbi:hypothetical protein Lser_V15G45502 [Lactuca serriola]